MYSLPEFRAYLNKFTDFARSDRFLVFFGKLPTIMTTSVIDYTAIFQSRVGPEIFNSYGLAMQCDEAELPGRVFATLDSRTYGPHFKIPFSTSFNDLRLSFMCMGNKVSGFNFRGILGDFFNTMAFTGLWEKRFFDDWMEGINPVSSYPNGGHYNFNYLENITTDIDIKHYDTTGEGFDLFQKGGTPIPTYGVRFIDCYPISMDAIPLSRGNGEPMKLNITFAYKRWSQLGVNGQPKQTNIPGSFGSTTNPSLPSDLRIGIPIPNGSLERNSDGTIPGTGGYYYKSQY